MPKYLLLFAALSVSGCLHGPADNCGKQMLNLNNAHLRTMDDIKCQAQRGNKYAIFALGRHYELGSNDIQKDEAKALKLYRRAAKDQAASSTIGTTFQKGGSGMFTVNNAPGKRGLAEAQYAIALMYFEGRGVDKNPKRAKRWMRRAAKSSHTAATKWLAAHGAE